MPIHPQAVVHSDAQVADDVEIGPFTVIEVGVRIGAGCVIESGCRIYRGTSLGENNYLAHSVALGGLPQDLGHDSDADTKLEIGSGNKFREFCTVHRATEKEDGVTRIGNDNYFMNGSHVGHDCQLGNNIILTNLATLGGHTRMEDHVVMGGLAGCHQFSRIGTRAMIAGAARVVSDVPPFALVEGHPARYRSVNAVGMKRAGMSIAERRAIKNAYLQLYLRGRSRKDVLSELLQSEFRGVRRVAEFYQQSRRGVVSGVRG